MTAPPIVPIATMDAATQDILRNLNNACAAETSFLSPAQWDALIRTASWARCFDNAVGILIAFDQGSAYENANFGWFGQRFAQFVYIDRIVISDDQRGQGLARHLYREFFAWAQAAGHDRITCEVNIDPPNPGSDTFHERLGFSEVGQATLAHNGKTVRYLSKQLGREDCSQERSG
jgi:uncharacterized protein